MNNSKSNKWYLIIGVFAIISMFFGGSLAYWQWSSDVNNKTNVTLTVTQDFRCDVDGGGNITSGEKYLVPTDCTNSEYVIKRMIKVNPIIYSEQMNVVMDLWLNVNTIDTDLRNSDNFRYALTTNSDSCTSDVVSSGTFKGKTNGSKVQLLDNQIYSDTYADRYYLYIWLDKKENDPDTRGKSFNFSLGGECVNEAKENPFYAVYSADDTSLRFYKEDEGVIIEGQPYEGRTVTKVYKVYENEHYYYNTISDMNTVPWRDDATNILKVYIEDEISPVDTSFWFYNFKNAAEFYMENLNVSNVKKMRGMFEKACYNADCLDLLMDGLENWNVSNVENMSRMFANTGRYVVDEFQFSDLSNWDVSNVENMNAMFLRTGENVSEEWSVGDLSTKTVTRDDDTTYLAWDVSNVTDMGWMFAYLGNKSSSFSLGDLSEWNVSNVVDMSRMFVEIGANSSSLDVGDLSTKEVTRDDGTTYTAWNVSNVENMAFMFDSFCASCETINIGDLGQWEVSNVRNMSLMFNSFGPYLNDWFVGDLSGWDVSNVSDMESMFYNAGTGEGDYTTNSFTLGDLGQWDVSNVKTMKTMFYGTGQKANSFNIGNLSNWNTLRVTNMYMMFYFAGQNDSNWSLDLSKWKVSQVTSYSQFNIGCESKVVSPKWSD